MPRIFSYGTLQREDIQIETFGRRLAGEPDALLGFTLGRVAIDEPAVAARLDRSHYDNALPAGPKSRLLGTVLEVTDDELLTTDRYERGAAYRRIAATTASGYDVWVYVHAPSGAAAGPASDA